MKRVFTAVAVSLISVASACSIVSQDKPDDSKELSDLISALVSNTESGYRGFLSSYPNSRFAGIAQDLLTTCGSGGCASDEEVQSAVSAAVSTARQGGRTTASNNPPTQAAVSTNPPAQVDAPKSAASSAAVAQNY